MTEMTTPSSGAAWTVIAQGERTILGAQGNAMEVMAVTFQLTDGTQATVNIPLAAYTPANVRQAIINKAATLADVNNLSG